MHGSRWNAVLLPLLLGLACVRCGDDETGAAVVVSTGLPREQKLSAFDDDDAKAACEALNDGASELISDRELIRSQCASQAIGTIAEVNETRTELTLDIAKCEAAAKACEAEPATYGISAEAGRDKSDCDDATANQQVLACEATVAEYEACVGKVLGQAKQALANVSCANGKALLQSDGQVFLDARAFTECELFLGKCPNVQIVVTVDE